MGRLFVGALAGLLVLPTSIQARESSEIRSDQAFADCNSPNLEAALLCLDRHLPAETRENLLQPDPPVMLNWLFGMFLRNNWGLWMHGSLYYEMREIGFSHADNMSGFIIAAYVASELDATFNLDTAVAEMRSVLAFPGEDRTDQN